jgi:hypothetical protein
MKTLSGLQDWLRRNPSADIRDRALAEGLVAELKEVLQ